jgi:citrate synthase
MTVNHGLKGVVALESDISRIDGERGVLEYRGFDIHDLAKHSSYEEVVYLLLHKHLPTRSELKEFSDDLAERRELPGKIIGVLYNLPVQTYPTVIYRTMVSYIGSMDQKLKVINPDENFNKAKNLIAKAPTIIAHYQNIRVDRPPTPPNEDLSHAANFLWMLKEREPDRTEEKALNLDLVLHAEHTLNASTFSARISASTLSDMYACVVSATGTLFGPRHGGAAQNVIEMLRDMQGMDKKEIEMWVDRQLNKGEKIPGFGHRVYKTIDPRAVELRQSAIILDELKGNDWVTLSDDLAEIVHQKKGINPNVDYYAASVYANLEIPDDQFINMFVMGRIAGWITHIIEEYERGQLLRPLQKYIGYEKRDYIPIDKRR